MGIEPDGVATFFLVYLTPALYWLLVWKQKVCSLFVADTLFEYPEAGMKRLKIHDMSYHTIKRCCFVPSLPPVVRITERAVRHFPMTMHVCAV